MFQIFDECVLKKYLKKTSGLLHRKSLCGSNSPNVGASEYLIADLSSIKKTRRHKTKYLSFLFPFKT
jgi:hypothetical protein